MGVIFLKRLISGLHRSRSQFISRLSAVLAGRGRFDEDFFDQLEELLITSDIGVGMTRRVMERLREKAGKMGLVGIPDLIELLRAEVLRVMGDGGGSLAWSDAGPTVYLFVGVNGVGKTTTIGKLAHRYTATGKKVILAACDTFRAGAVEQLKIWAERTGSDFVGQKPGADPGAVVYDALTAAQARRVDLLMVDTAGRLHTRAGLMEELKKIKRVISRKEAGAPHETLLVLDATTGQNALNQARVLDESLGLTGLVMAKLDGTAKGGMVLAIKEQLGLPVKLIGLGEGLDDLVDFEPAEFVNALFSNDYSGSDGTEKEK